MRTIRADSEPTLRHQKPLVSIIVTTKNERKNIANCLRSVKNQTYDQIEVIVVDNYSTDGTARIAHAFGALVYLKGKERSQQRNYGAMVSKGTYVIYVDADMILSPKLIEECVEKCEKENVDALYIEERIVGNGFWIKIRDFERNFYNGTAIDAVRFIRKDIFYRVGGFDEFLVGPEDWDFDKKITEIGRKKSVIYIPLYHNEGQFSFRKYLQKKSYYVQDFEKYVKKWGASDLTVAKQIGLPYRFLWVFIEAGKWRRIVRFPAHSFLMYTLRTLVALTYFKSTIQSRALSNRQKPGS